MKIKDFEVYFILLEYLLLINNIPRYLVLHIDSNFTKH